MDGPTTHQACGWEWTPKYIVRDRDSVYGEIFTRRLSCHVHSRPANCTPVAMAEWHTERLIGSIRQECLDHVVVFGERHLRHVLLSYMHYYNSARTHLSLNNDAPLPRAVPGCRAHSPDTNSRWITPSLCSDLISDKDTGVAPVALMVRARLIKDIETSSFSAMAAWEGSSRELC